MTTFKKRAMAVTLFLVPMIVLTSNEKAATTQVSNQSQGNAEMEWLKYTYLNEEFSVTFPAAPFVWDISRRLPSERWEIEEGRVFGAYADGVVYMITSHDKPRASETLEHFINNFALRHAPAGKEMAKRDLILGSFAGREFSYALTSSGSQDLPTKSTVERTVRIYRTDKHAYIVEAYGEEGRQLSVKKFSDSFTLSAKPDGSLIARMPSPILPSMLPPAPKSEASPTPAATNPSTQSDASSGPADGMAFAQKEVTRKAILLFRPEPGFTEKARKNNVTGVVRLRMVVGADGKVSNISVVKKLPDGLTERAINAAQHILFIPASRGGRRVSQWVTIEYSFNIF